MIRVASLVGISATTSLLSAHAAPKPNSEMKAVLDQLQSKGGKPIESLTAAEARNQPTPTDAVKSLLEAKKKDVNPEPVAEVRDIQIDGAAGKISARLYKPEGKGALPVVVYFHGGGFVIATNDVYDATPRALANLTHSIFLSVEYRKAPESKFPAAHEDAFAAYQWVLKNAASFGGDPMKVAVAGESAGANLALNTAIKARDMKVQLPVHELLVYPVASSDMNSKSYEENSNAKPLNRPMMSWFVKNYLNNPGEAKDPRIDLVHANLKGLAPATVITAEIDPLRSDGKELSEKLKAAGVKVHYEDYKGVTHEFFGMAAVLKEAKKAQTVAADDLKKSFIK
ncbi:MAG: alpha/beta hydrolase [Cryobacterium sp.]|nr:alpha/beta hydrolase [Oligoflexia bacterium]